MNQPVNMPQAHGDTRLKCGTCRWFVQGFNGKTCQITRQVNADVRACIEYQPYKPSTFQNIEKDKFLIDMRKTLKVWTDDTIKDYDRRIRDLRVYSKDYKILSDAMDYIEESKLAELGQRFEQCQIHLENLLELRFNIKDKVTELNSFAEEVKAYLFTEYRDHVQALKNESERNAFYRAAAPELFRAVDQMDSLKDKAEIAYQNLKDGHFNMARKLDAVNEIYKARVQSLATRYGGSRTSG